MRQSSNTPGAAQSFDEAVAGVGQLVGAAGQYVALEEMAGELQTVGDVRPIRPAALGDERSIGRRDDDAALGSARLPFMPLSQGITMRLTG